MLDSPWEPDGNLTARLECRRPGFYIKWIQWGLFSQLSFPSLLIEWEIVESGEFQVPTRN
jgi:hypothetical protein